MTQPTPSAGVIRGENLIFPLGATLGSIGGLVYGYREAGIIGAVFVFPFGAIVGLGLIWVFSAAIFLIVMLSWLLWIRFTQGPQEVKRFMTHGPKTHDPKDPTAMDETERTR